MTRIMWLSVSTFSKSFKGAACAAGSGTRPSNLSLHLPCKCTRQPCLSPRPITTRIQALLHNAIGRTFQVTAPKVFLRFFHSTTICRYALSHKSQPRTRLSIMGKKKQIGEYNDFLDGEKLRDNSEVRTSLRPTSTRQDISPPSLRQDQRSNKKHANSRGGPKKPPLTHFLCLPLITDSSRPQLERGLSKLKTDLEATSLVPPKAIRPVGTLHLTLGVMSLDASKLEDANQYLQSLNLHNLFRDISMQIIAEKAAEDGTISENLNAAALPDADGLTINLESLVPMQQASKTSILYASPKDETQRLMPFAAALKKAFTEKGFVLDDERDLRLHATVVNSIYAKSAILGNK
ncbi:MAG: hypothetical protein EOO38_11055, partial [Cytophagaceae bacterium]